MINVVVSFSPVTEQLTTGRLGRNENKEEKVDQPVLILSNPMEGRWTWVHCAFNQKFQVSNGFSAPRKLGFTTSIVLHWKSASCTSISSVFQVSCIKFAV